MTLLDQRADAHRMERVPLAFAIGMRIGDAAADVADATLPAGDRIALAQGGPDPLALLPFIDQLSSVPLAHGADGMGMATIDLAVSFASVSGTGPFHGIARAPMDTGAARLVTTQVAAGDGRVVATSSAWFSMGAPPGGGENAIELPVPDFVPRGPFQAMIGLAPDGDDGATLAPDVRAAVGWVGLPALHGGALAALLARAAQHRVETLGRADLRLATIAIRFLRAAGTGGTTARATVDAIGRRTARLSVSAVSAGAEVASAQVLFVVD